MNMPKITKINSPSPYDVKLQNGIYQFETDHQLSYFCSFTDLTKHIAPVLYMYDVYLYEFSFYCNTSLGYTTYDERVSATIKSLLHSFFNDNPLVHNVLYYVCDYSDGNHKARNILFDRWFKDYSDLFIKTDVEIEIKDVATIYGCLLRKDDFPFEQILKSEVLDRADGFLIKKYGE